MLRKRWSRPNFFCQPCCPVLRANPSLSRVEPTLPPAPPPPRAHFSPVPGERCGHMPHPSPRSRSRELVFLLLFGAGSVIISLVYASLFPYIPRRLDCVSRTHTHATLSLTLDLSLTVSLTSHSRPLARRLEHRHTPRHTPTPAARGASRWLALPLYWRDRVSGATGPD